MTELGASIVAVKRPVDAPCVVLTYDDGPDPHGTTGILDALAAHEARATFFVLLSRTRRYPSLLDDVLSQGHEIGLHGLDHQRLTRFEPAVAGRRIVDAKKELEDTAGRAVRWFRPPYGAQSMDTWRATHDAGLMTVLWGADCYDWREASDDERLLAGATSQPGAIVLLHEAFAGSDDGVSDGPQPQVNRARLTQSLLDCFHSRGFPCTSLGTALEGGQPTMQVLMWG